MKVTIEAVNLGKTGESKYGTWQMACIKTKEYGEQWLNGFLNDGMVLSNGDVIDIEVKDEEYNGKIQKKFKIPKGTKTSAPTVSGNNDTVLLRIQTLEQKLDIIIDMIKGIAGPDQPIHNPQSVVNELTGDMPPSDSFVSGGDGPAPF